MLAQSNPTPTIPVKDLNRARKFYEQKLGLGPVGDTSDPEVQLYKSGDTTIQVYHSEFAGTNKGTALTWEVDDVEEEVKELTSKGITFEHYEDMPDTKIEGDIHVSGNFKIAWFKDPDGNILCMHNH